ncbi:hypothetical protein ABMA27_015708 [Loxostege sticticalis]|uniref:Sodium channel protein Nach n=1 Tax=Loxostege sticticalis TaxID=481309 RepID=A0ABR3I402_LOXSC
MMSKIASMNKEVPLACMLLTEAQLHGVKRLADKKYRFYWAIAIMFLMWGSISLVMLLISRYLDHPTRIVRVENYRTNMSFPSVLIFLELSYHDYKIDALLDNMVFPPNLNRSYIQSVIRQLATFHSPDVMFTQNDLENIERVLDYNDLDLRDVTEALTSTCEEALLRCRWKGEMTNCSTLFRMELSEFGYCCVFNGRSLKRELASGAPITPTPSDNFYTTNIGPRNGLTFALNQSLQLSNMDLTYKWLTIASPQRYVDSIHSNGTPISPGKEVWFGYDTVSFHVSEDARSLHPGLRRCVLSQTKLQYFPVYHKYPNCTMRATLAHCNCVMLTHPARPGVPYCRARSLMCARHIAGTLNGDNCGCPMTCDVDKAEMSAMDFMMSPNVTPIDSF